MIIRRSRYLKAVRSALARNPVCALLGPRQCGKTTLARQLLAEKPPPRRTTHYFDLETATGSARLAHAELTLDSLRGLVVIDEIQRRPELFTTLRPLADRPGVPARFLILGSASPDLIRGVSESLAGRVGFVDMSPFDLTETGSQRWPKLWLRGGFPRSFLSSNDAESLRWRQDFIRTILERDIPQLGIRIPSEALRRFWMMLAHYHGQVWNGAELARALGVTDRTVRGYLDILNSTYLVRPLAPWFENISKRQYRSPKVYVRDSGLLHALLSVGAHADLEGHPKYGASWEGFALEQVFSIAGHHDAYFWGTHGGAELDLLLFRHGRRYGIEFKCADAPLITKSLHVALSDLSLERAWIVYPGRTRYPVHERVEAVPLTEIAALTAVIGR